MDNKSGLFYRFLERLAKRWKCPKERLWRALACLHAAVITKSLHIPDLIDEPKWMDGSPSECAQIVSNFVAVGKAKKAERGYLPQTDRFSITGLSYVTRQVSKKGGMGRRDKARAVHLHLPRTIQERSPRGQQQGRRAAARRAPVQNGRGQVQVSRCGRACVAEDPHLH